MAAPYSVDIREKVIIKYKTGGISQRDLAKLLHLGISTVKRYIKLEKEKGNVAPRLMGKGRPSRIDDKGYETISQLLAENPCLTLEELSDKYFEVHQLEVGRSVLSRACKKLNLSRKKLSIYAAEQERDDVKKKRRLFEGNS